MGERIYNGVIFWMMTFATALWGVACDRPAVEPSHIVMVLVAASIWTFAYGWGSISAETQSLSTRDKWVICATAGALLAVAIVSTLLEWPSGRFFRDMPMIVLPMSVGIGLAYMFGAASRRQAAELERIASRASAAN